jgi:hypothetical protein
LTLDIVGAGPAGCAAALEALSHGCTVCLYEQGAFPRHKVCGEFLSPELRPLLERFGIPLEGARITRIRLHLGRCRKLWRLEEPAVGLSRYTLDDLLVRRAVAAGAEIRRERMSRGDILATGRNFSTNERPRLFGFKAHFSGPSDDALDLFFGSRFYAGICGVEGGAVNVCGLASEDLLRSCSFQPDDLLTSWTRGLHRTMDWIFTGPLQFGPTAPTATSYRAGDALGFIDPFTGTGLLAGVWTGIAAGRAAAEGRPVAAYQAACREALFRQYRTSMLFRELLRFGVAEWLAPLVPGKWLFSLTRPRIAA